MLSAHAGVGKTATVEQLAAQKGKRVIRFNMSEKASSVFDVVPAMPYSCLLVSLCLSSS